MLCDLVERWEIWAMIIKKIVLFSPNGYVGSAIKEKIQEEGTLQLYEITRDSDLEQYKENYDVLIYSAAASHGSAEKYVQDNVVTAVTMMNFCKLHGIKRIIYLSSDSIYGEINTDVVTESATMLNPGIYGVTKYLAERIIIESGIPYYILRMPGVVGKSWREVFICNLMMALKNNEHINLYNMDRAFNNILDIDDLTQFINRLCTYENINRSEVFLLGNIEKPHLKEVVYYIKKLYHSTSEIDNMETDAKRYFTLDVSKAVEFGYSSKKIWTIIDELYQVQKKEEELL